MITLPWDPWLSFYATASWYIQHLINKRFCLNKENYLLYRINNIKQIKFTNTNLFLQLLDHGIIYYVYL